jgi:small neutral amino acid transporter SnatA (MarC family)
MITSILIALVFMMIMAVIGEYVLSAYSTHIEHLTVSEESKTSMDDE